jgi:olefin beta-lactone synthetase
VAMLPDRAPALITYTSGTTGRPKGSDRTHDLLIEQHLALSEHFPTQEDDVDMPCFPVVTLHNLAEGVSTVMPCVDFAAPSEVNASVVVDQARRAKVTRISGAPAYLSAISRHLVQ